MIANLLIGLVLEVIGSLFMIYNIAQGSMFGHSGHWPWALMGLVIMIVGLILLYAAFRPVVM